VRAFQVDVDRLAAEFSTLLPYAKGVFAQGASNDEAWVRALDVRKQLPALRKVLVQYCGFCHTTSGVERGWALRLRKISDAQKCMKTVPAINERLVVALAC